MSPLRACHRHGSPGCQCGRRQPAERRSYSGTALERQVRAEVLEAFGRVCHYCHQPIAEDEPLELAHLVAHADGGAFDVDNVRPSHRGCNRSAGR